MSGTMEEPAYGCTCIMGNQTEDVTTPVLGCEVHKGSDIGQTIERHVRFHDGVQALLGVLNDIGGGNPWNYNVITEAAEDALNAALKAMDLTAHTKPQ